jgi:hypothetical protein
MGFDHVMKSIKTLYLSAKAGNQKDANAYSEAVVDLLNQDPIGYVSESEYIISSSMGLQTLKPFIEKYGLAIPVYDIFEERINECVQKCQDANVKADAYLEALDMLHQYQEQYDHCLQMFDAYTTESTDINDYIRTYYSSTNGHQNRKLMAGMIDKFGECAIPDVLMTAESIGEDAVKTALTYLESLQDKGPGFYQWLSEAASDLTVGDSYTEQLRVIYDKSASAIMESAESKRVSYFREAALSGVDMDAVPYTEQEKAAIMDTISRMEYDLTAMESADAVAQQQRIYKMYEDYADVIAESDPASEDVADSVIPMQPAATTEGGLAVVNTRNKKTGEMPLYIKRNHDMSNWGEEDAPPRKINRDPDEDDTEREPTLDDFRRPSAPKEEPETEPDEDDDDTPAAPAAPGGGVNNYYYYTYQNSLNKNTNSYNKDSSSHDRHDMHDNHARTTTDNSVHDDHSRHTTDNSIHNVNGKPEGEDSDESEGESGPFDLGPSATSSGEGNTEEMVRESALEESTKSDWEAECKAFHKLFGLDLNKLGDIISPNEYITLTIGGTKMKFKTSRGYSLSSGKRVKAYTSVPTSIHNFNVNKEKITNDEIGIDDAILHHIKLYARDYDPTMTARTAIKHYGIKPQNIIFKPVGEIGLTFHSTIDHTHGFGLNIQTDLHVDDGGHDKAYESVITEADDGKPESDHPIRDTMMDIDRKTTKAQQGAKKKVQEIQQVGRAAMKPFNRAKNWVTKLVYDWKDADENNIKERMADPHARKNIFSAISWSIKTGSLAKAGLLLNPVILFLTVTKKINTSKNEKRLRNEMLGELKTEMAIIDEKIRDADRAGDRAAKYKLMRFKNEMQKKYLRVADTTKMNRIL